MKKIRLISLIVLICVLLTGCSTKSGGGKASGTSDNLQSPLVQSTKVVVPKTQTHFYNGKDFSNGVAWVQRDSSHWECIDDKGKTLFSLGDGSVPLTDFTEGAALIKTTNSKNEEEKKIVEKSGAVVFPKDDGYKYQFIFSYGNYTFVKRHINTFEKTEDQTGIVDNTGKWVLEPTPELTAESFYMLNGINPAYGFLAVSYRDNNLYDAHSNEFFKSDRYNGDRHLELIRRTLDHLYKEDLVFLQTRYPYNKNYPITLVMRDYDEFDLAKLGFHDTGTGFYDRNHNMVIDLSSYYTLKYYDQTYFSTTTAIGGFSYGYCSIGIINPQGSAFWVVIDKKGNRMFEPIPQQIGKVSCGRVLVKAYDGLQYYIDVNGKTVIANIQNGSDFNENGLAKIGISNSEKNAIYYIDTDGNIAF